MAVAVALCYGVAMAASVGHRRLRQPWLVAAFVAGAVAFPVSVILVDPIQALLAAIFGWDMGAYSTNLAIGVLGALVAAAVNEILKLAAGLLALSWGGRDADAAGFGGAAGAGFAAVSVYQVIGLALMARTLPIGGSPDLATPFFQQFAFVAVNTASTALAVYGAAVGRIGTYLLAAILYQTLYGVLGLLFSLQVYGVGVWTSVSVAAALALLAAVLVLTSRSPVGVRASRKTS